MKSYDIVAYTAEDGGIYCVPCASLMDEDEVDLEPVFADSEWDYYPCCDECESVIDEVNLTSEGRAFEGLEED